MYGIYSFSGFRGQHHSRPDPVPQDILDDVLPDPDDLADFDLPDQQALIDAFLDGLCKESDHEFRGLSDLLASLPDPSLSQGQVEAVPVTVARERGVIPEASNETLEAGVLRHGCLIRLLYFHFETPRKFGRRSLQNAGGFSTGMERRAIAAKLRYVISFVNMYYTRIIYVIYQV